MLKMDLPAIDHDSVFEASKLRFQDVAFTKRLSDGKADVLHLGKEYIALGSIGRLSEISSSKSVPPHIEGGDMQTLYKSGLLRKKSEARRFYEKMRLSSPFRVCPFCLHRTVKTLDHYLPKEKFGAYAVLPANLIPCCRDCNSEKDQYASQDVEQNLLHPYFDNVDIFDWLGCEIETAEGFCTPTFFVRSSAIDEPNLSRLITQMEKLELFELFDVEGGRELNDMAETIVDVYRASGRLGVAALCSSMARSRGKLARNYWRAVLWRTAAATSGYCDLSWCSSLVTTTDIPLVDQKT